MAKAKSVAKQQARVLEPLYKKVLRLMLWYGAPVSEKQRDEFARLIFKDIVAARSSVYDAAVSDLLDHAERAGAVVDPAPQRSYKPGAVVKLLENATDPTGPVGGRVTVRELDPETEKVTKSAVRVDESNRKDSSVVKVVSERVNRGVGHHVRAAARDAIEDTQATSRGDPIGYARVLTGSENCSFCAMLASRGPVYRSEKTAGERSSPIVDPVTELSITAYHIGCDCQVIPVFDKDDWEGVDAYQELEDLWYDVLDDPAYEDENGNPPSGRDARRAFRRAWEKKIRANGGKVPSKFLAASFS